VTRTTGLSHIVLTHGHHDHQGGVERILQECLRRGLPEPTVLKRCPSRGDSFPCLVRGARLQELHDGDELRTEGATLRVVATPGHTSDHISLVIMVRTCILMLSILCM
jgi:glyoxylase-like metal-dependent hydrolase (beta-lactamase superfamily II)